MFKKTASISYFLNKIEKKWGEEGGLEALHSSDIQQLLPDPTVPVAMVRENTLHTRESETDYV